MKKYSLFILVLLGLTFSCNQPASDGKNNPDRDASATETTEKSTAIDDNTEQQQEVIVNKAVIEERTEKLITDFSSVIEITDEEKKELEALSNTYAPSIAQARRERDKIRLERKMWDESLGVFDNDEVRKLKRFLEEKWNKEDAEFQRRRNEREVEERRIKAEANKNNK